MIIIAGTKTNVAIVAPFTTNIQTLNFHHTLEIEPSNKNGLKELSVALLFQVRAIDKKRLKIKIGQLENIKLEEINNMLRKLLSL